MVLEALMQKAGSKLTGGKILHHVALPSIAVLPDLEAALDLERRYSQREILAVYAPEFFDKKPHRRGSFKLRGRKIEGLFLPGEGVSRAMSSIYEQDGSEEGAGFTMASLETAVSQETARRAESQEQLGRVGMKVAEQGNHDAEEAQAFIRHLTVAQFGEPEYFLRELIQNSSGAAPGGRIDVYIDQEARLVRVDDNGRGMSQQVMSDVYFKLFASLNEGFEGAEGKWGIGGKAVFGVGHEYVIVDSRPADNGLGGRATVNKLLEISDFMPTQRIAPGTSIEAKLAGDSDIKFERLLEVLEECAYVKTPIYLHNGGTTRQVNKQLLPKGQPDTVTFSNDFAQGHLTKADHGKVVLLSRGLPLASVECSGYTGAVNCDHFDKTWSRDTVKKDAVLEQVLAMVKSKGLELLSRDVDMAQFSLRTRLADYRQFLSRTLFNERGSLNEAWIMQHIDDIAGDALDNPGGISKFFEFADNITKNTVTVKVIGPILGTILWPLRKCFERFGDITWALPAANFVWLGYEVVANINSINPPARLIAASAPLLALMAAAGLFEAELAIRYAGKLAIDGLTKKTVTHYANHSNFEDFRPLSKDRTIPQHTIKFGAYFAAGAAAFFGLKFAVSNIAGNLQNIITHEAVDASTLQRQMAEQASAAAGQGGVPEWLMYAGGAAAAAAGAYSLYSLRKRSAFRAYDGQLDEQQEKLLEDVRGVVNEQGMGNTVSVQFSNNLKKGQQSFAVRNGKIVLNLSSSFPPWAPVLAYAADALKDSGISRRIGEKYVRPK